MAVATSKAPTGPERGSRGAGRSRRRRRLAAAQGADDRRRGEDPRPGVRRHLDLQDPLPRGPEAARAAAHRRGLPPLQPGRRRAPAGDPAHAARRVPAPAGDPPGARHRRLHRAAAQATRARSAAPPRSASRCAASAARSCSTRPACGDQLLRELQEFGIVAAKRRDGREVYDETDLEIVRAAAELSRFGVAGRNLRVFRTSADREAALLEQLLGPQLRSRSQARRKEAIENLESLAAVCGHLKHLLLVRDLRRLKAAARVERRRLPPMPRVSRKPADRRRRRSASGSWSRIRTTCRAGGRGRSGSRTCAGDRRRGRSGRPCSRPSAAPGVRADFRCTAADRRRALRLGAGDRGDAVRADPALGAARDRGMRPDGEATEVTLTSEEALRGLSRLGSPMMRGAARAAPRRGPGRHRAGCWSDDAGARARTRPRSLRRRRRRSGGGGATRRSGRRSARRRAGDAALRARRGRARASGSRSTRSRSRRRGALPGGDRRARSGPAGVLTAHEHRVRRAAGSSYPDLIRLRSGHARGRARRGRAARQRRARSRRVLEVCAREGVAVVPFGGGTSVVGGVEPLAGEHERRDLARPAAAARRRRRPASR